jgi:(2R)-sulfolactate sulfo-lyase subunit alpha
VPSPPDFLAHAEGDSVAVAMRDLAVGQAEGAYLAAPEDETFTVLLAEPVRLGHKFALRDIPAGADVIEYGVPVARATHDIAVGQHAHVHNLRSIRWPASAG